METSIHVSGANHRTRKLLLLMPILVVPFLILLLWAIGLVGSPDSHASAGSPLVSGMNLDLPAAAPSADSNWNKMSYYEQAEKEAQRLEMQMRADSSYNPYEEMGEEGDMPPLSEADYAEQSFGSHSGAFANRNSSANNTEREILQKLRLLEAQIDDQQQKSADFFPEEPTPTYEQPSMPDLPEAVSPDYEDPEISKLDQMLDKIITIQHPEKMRQELQQQSATAPGTVLPVQTGSQNLTQTLLQARPDTSEKLGNGFFSGQVSKDEGVGRREIRAAIHETQTILNGATVKLRLSDDIYINGRLIPRESFVYGLANLSGERLRIEIKSIRMGTPLFPVHLTVYDMDGIEGIRVPGTISKRVASQSAEKGMQGLGITTVSPSVGIQAAGLGIEAARSFLGKKIKLVRVTLKAGYQVLLRDENRKT